MRDYHIYNHFDTVQGISRTNPMYQRNESRVKAIKQAEEQENSLLRITPRKIASTGLAVASKINNYVGELTENKVKARKTQVGLTYTGFGLIALTNPVTALIGASLYTGGQAISYGVTVYKENVKSDFAKALSGGVNKTR